jgi:protein SCO1/2
MKSGLTRRFDSHGCACALLFALITIISSSAVATLPPVDRVGFAPRNGTLLPLDSRFVDENGRASALGEYFGTRPVIVVLGYYGCSNLCGLLLNGLAASLDAAGLRTGRDLDVVVASIAPLDTPDIALRRKRSVLGAAPSPGEVASWHFLTGDERSIDRLTAALGYRYAYDEAERQYAHAAGIVLVSAHGHISHALYGVSFPARALRDAVRAAASSDVPDLVEQTPSDDASAVKWLLCFHYDPHTGRYSFAAMNAARLAALGALVALGAFIGRRWLGERRSARDRTVPTDPR